MMSSQCSFFCHPSVSYSDDTFRINIKKFTKRRKRQKKPRGWLITYIILSSMAFFYSKRLITAIQLLLNRN
ncbi:hypothetical protein WANA31_0592 [Wolbachia endosymbiont of Drosophila ananassae]|nr:hypothetical protein WANA31_0592 [Wolbachia endosymbiont of Drosophila ananassae]RLT63285.1 hypothetical protein WANA34_0660 [Wolbachia endosymbiont of Drosophila ananassae]